MKIALDKKEKRQLARILAALGMFLPLFIADKALAGGLGGVFGGRAGWVFPFCLYLAVYLFIGYDVLWRAARNIARGQVFDENFLMCVATVGAFALAVFRGASGLDTEGFDEACAVLLFYQTGEWFQDCAAGRARKSVARLMDIRPDYANLLLPDGTAVRTDPAAVHPGDCILVNPGEKVPLDGTVVAGASDLDTRALTGESLPRAVSRGDAVISGSVNTHSQLTVRAEKEYTDSTVAKILELVENAAEQKSKAENFITRFARWYTPAVCAAALLLAVVPGLVTGDWAAWVYRALSFLVVSCPCALVISIPLSFFAGIGAASRYGILVKGSAYLEKLHRANIFVFDKTGTLTKGNFAVVRIDPAAGTDEEGLLRLAACAEQLSEHPLGKAVVRDFRARQKTELPPAEEFSMIPGRGVSARIEGRHVLAGNLKMLEEDCGMPPASFLQAASAYLDRGCTLIWLALDGRAAGFLALSDTVRPESARMISRLKALGVQPVLLTGDHENAARTIAGELGIDDVRADCLPEDKLTLIGDLQKRGEAVCMIGDGINDAPALKKANVGIAMGGVGSDIAVDAADIALIDDQVQELPYLLALSRRMITTIKCNLSFSMGLNFLAIILAISGILGPVAGALVHNAGSIVVILHSALLLTWKEKQQDK